MVAGWQRYPVMASDGRGKGEVSSDGQGLQLGVLAEVGEMRLRALKEEVIKFGGKWEMGTCGATSFCFWSNWRCIRTKISGILNINDEFLVQNFFVPFI